MPFSRTPARRRWLATAAALLGAVPLAAIARPRPIVDVWKSPSCGCCADWIAHMRDAGFTMRVHDTGNVAARSRLGMPQRFGSCHTAKVDDYVIEGHVPADDVRRLLRDRPDALGLAVPGMPIGSPGMDGPEYGGRTDPFDTVLVGRDGSARVFASHR